MVRALIPHPLRSVCLLLLISVFGSQVAVGEATYEMLKNFSVPGRAPFGGLVADNEGNLYGTTEEGGNGSNGTFFKLSADGSLTTLHHFAPAAQRSRLCLGSDGWFYGTTQGYSGFTGTMYRISKAGSFERLHDFATGGGLYPAGELLETEPGVFYGLALAGGANGEGTVFKYVAGTGVSVLCDLPAGVGNPHGGLIRGNDGKLYGAIGRSIFRVSLGGEFEIVYSFPYYPASVNKDPLGKDVRGPLLLASDGNIYGVTESGGANNGGTVFQLSPNGDVTVFHHFEEHLFPNGGLVEGADGWIYGITSHTTTFFRISKLGTYEFIRRFNVWDPYAGLTRSGDAFYGVSYRGGIDRAGSLFKYTEANGFEIVHEFGTGDGHGAASLLRPGSDGKLYGALDLGGALGKGAILRVTPGEGAEFWHGFAEIPQVFSEGFDTTHRTGVTEAADGAFYCFNDFTYNGERSTISKISKDGVETLVRTFESGSETRITSPFIRGADGRLYTSVWNNNAPATISRLENSGQLTPIHEFPELTHREAIPITSGSDGALYGLVPPGSLGGFGSIFRLALDGTFSTLHEFTAAEGRPYAFALSEGPDGAFYGFAYDLFSTKSFYKITPDGQFTVIRSYENQVTNMGSLTLAGDGNFYGPQGSALVRVNPSGRIRPIRQLEYALPTGVTLGSDGNLYGVAQGTIPGGHLFRIVLTPSAPEPQDDHAFARKLEAVVIPVLDNDSDPDDQLLTLVSVTQGKLGKVEIVDGAIRYTAGANFSTQDSFTYTVSDGHGGEATATMVVTQPFITEAGHFVTTVVDQAGRLAGTMKIQVNRLGRVTGSISLGGIASKIKGTLGVDGKVELSIDRPRHPKLTVKLALDVDNSPAQLTAEISEGSEPALVYQTLPVSAHVTSLPDSFTSSRMTLRLSAPEGDGLPAGYGWAVVRVKRSGAVQMSGKLGDGSAFSLGTMLQRRGEALLCLPFRKGKGELFGSLDFNHAGIESNGTLKWRKAASVGGTFPDGFETDVTAYLSPYEKPARGKQVLTYAEGILDAEFIGGGIGPVVASLLVSPNDSTTQLPPVLPPYDLNVRLSVDRETGRFTGSLGFSGSASRTQFSGMFDQTTQRGVGNFVNGAISGAVNLTPR